MTEPDDGATRAPHAVAPPQDITAEQGVLGSMLLSADTIADMSARLRPGDFYRPSHVTIFDTVMELFTKGLPVDPITVLSRLSETGDIDRVGGAPYLAVLVEHANPASAGYYATSVTDKATERRILKLSAHAAQLVATPGETAAKVARVRQAADDLGDQRETTPGRWVGEAVSDALDAIDAASRPEVTGTLIPTGYADLDRLLGGGLRPGQVMVVAGRPGLGKSTLGFDICRNAAIRRGLTSAVVSLEMTEPEIMQRLLSAESRIPLHQIRTGDLTGREMARVIDQIQPITDAPLRLLSQAGTTMPVVGAEARRMRHRHDLRLLMVDYLQLIQTPAKSENRERAIADMSRSFKIMCMELGLAGLLISQLNRGPETRSDRRPSLGDLRESGSIEQDADIVVLIHRPDADNPDSDRPGEVDFIVAKHRGGPTGVVTVANQLHLARFADMAI